MRWSQYFIPTLREDPADAEVISHKLLLRAGVIRQLSAGIYSFLPLGQRIALKVMQILREEMNAIGGQEEAQLLNYLKASGLRRGLVLNFGATSFQHKRMVLG